MTCYLLRSAAAALRISALPAALTGAAVFWPPAAGAMLLVPASGDLAGTVNLARAGGAALLGPGPWPGSLVVRGERDRLGRLAWHRGTAVLAAPARLCGSAT